MDAVDFLDEMLASSRFRGMIDTILTDSPWNCTMDESGKKLREDDIITQDTVQKICHKIKTLLGPKGKLLSRVGFDYTRARARRRTNRINSRNINLNINGSGEGKLYMYLSMRLALTNPITLTQIYQGPR